MMGALRKAIPALALMQCELMQCDQSDSTRIGNHQLDTGTGKFGKIWNGRLIFFGRHCLLHCVHLSENHDCGWANIGRASGTHDGVIACLKASKSWKTFCKRSMRCEVVKRVFVCRVFLHCDQFCQSVFSC
jgi:hypothetical protein